MVYTHQFGLQPANKLLWLGNQQIEARNIPGAIPAGPEHFPGYVAPSKTGIIPVR